MSINKVTELYMYTLEQLLCLNIFAEEEVVSSGYIHHLIVTDTEVNNCFSLY